MKILARLVGGFIANAIGLYIATLYVPGVTIPLALMEFSFVVLVLTLINVFVRPFLKFVLTPIIILTLGFGVIVVNALVLYFLDFLLPTVTIEGLRALVLTTLIITAANLIVGFSAKKL